MKYYLVLFCLIISGSLTFGQSVEIYGKIIHPSSRSIFLQKNDRDYITGNSDKKYMADVDGNGVFHIVLQTTTIDEWSIQYGDDVSLIYLKPGDKLSVTFNQFDYYSGYQVSGGNDADLYFVRNLNQDSTYLKITSNFNSEVAQFKDLRANLEKRKEKAEIKLAYLKSYRSKHPMSSEFYNWLKNQYAYEPYERFCVSTLIMNRISTNDSLLAILKDVDIHNDDAAKCSANYNDFVQYFCALKTSGSLNDYRISDVFKYGISNLEGATRDILLTRQISNIVGIDSIYNSLYPLFTETVTSPELKTLVDVKRADYLKYAAIAHKPENINNYTDLNEIFKKYSGKVIYVDFWASWCVPCRNEMPYSKILREKLKGKDVIFVFLGYRDDKANWMAARQQLNIQGEHYFLDQKLMKQAGDIFNISGIPHYAIIDRRGQIVDKDATRPGDEHTLSSILTLL